MRKHLIVGALCGIAAFAVAVAPASAADVLHVTCRANTSWSVSLTTATATYSNVTCDSEQATAALVNMFPQWAASGGEGHPPTFSQTYSYTPVAGLCLGQLAGTIGPWSGTGVLKNDGNLHNLIVIEGTRNDGAIGFVVETHAGLLQNACSSSFQSTATWSEVVANK